MRDVPAAATPAADAKSAFEIGQRARSFLRAGADLLIGNRVADADVHGYERESLLFKSSS